MKLGNVKELENLLEKHVGKKAVFFDMDGTFINTEVIHSMACQQMIAELNPGKDVPGPEWFETEFTGLPDSKVFEILKDKELVPANYEVRDFLDRKCDFFIDRLDAVNLAEIFHDEIKNFLQLAREKKLKTGLVTASEGIVTHQILKKFKFAELFDVIVTRDDTSVSKPDPEPYIYAMKKIDVNSKDCLIFEDSDTGYASATATEADVYRVTWYQ